MNCEFSHATRGTACQQGRLRNSSGIIRFNGSSLLPHRSAWLGGHCVPPHGDGDPGNCSGLRNRLWLVKGCENMQTQGQEHDIYSSKPEECWKILELQWAFQVDFVSKPRGQLGVLEHKWDYSSWFMICIVYSFFDGTWMPTMDLGWYWMDMNRLCNIKFDEVLKSERPGCLFLLANLWVAQSEMTLTDEVLAQACCF